VASGFPTPPQAATASRPPVVAPRPRRDVHRTPRRARVSSGGQIQSWDAGNRRRSSGAPRSRASLRPWRGQSLPLSQPSTRHGRRPRKCPAAVLVGSESSARHGCTRCASRLVITASVIRLPHFAQRNFRSFSGTSPLPASMMVCRSAGPRRPARLATDRPAEPPVLWQRIARGREVRHPSFHNHHNNDGDQRHEKD
jgi:hypothetical protein